MRDSFAPLPVEPGFCECGCGEKTRIAPQTRSALGHVRGEPIRFVNGHSTRQSPVDFIEDPETHCWIGQLSKFPAGYGNRQGTPAHRLYYEELVGPIPEGLVTDHLCRNRDCVNPGHLEPVTNRENILRGEGITAQNARKTHCKRGHPLSGDNLYIDPSTGGRVCRVCRSSVVRKRCKRGWKIQARWNNSVNV